MAKTDNQVQPSTDQPSGVEILAKRKAEILGHAALAFLADLHRRFEHERRRLLGERKKRQVRFDAGELPSFQSATANIRQSDWKVAAIPEALLDRRIEITGPVDR